MTAHAARRFVVRGRVQGVFYRRSAQIEAESLGLAGWVRNLDDGTVEAFATGTPAALDAFAAWLALGPRHARVEQVSQEIVAAEAVSGFEIR